MTHGAAEWKADMMKFEDLKKRIEGIDFNSIKPLSYLNESLGKLVGEIESVQADEIIRLISEYEVAREEFLREILLASEFTACSSYYTEADEDRVYVYGEGQVSVKLSKAAVTAMYDRANVVYPESVAHLRNLASGWNFNGEINPEHASLDFNVMRDAAIEMIADAPPESAFEEFKKALEPAASTMLSTTESKRLFEELAKCSGNIAVQKQFSKEADAVFGDGWARHDLAVDSMSFTDAIDSEAAEKMYTRGGKRPDVLKFSDIANDDLRAAKSKLDGAVSSLLRACDTKARGVELMTADGMLESITSRIDLICSLDAIESAFEEYRSSMAIAAAMLKDVADLKLGFAIDDEFESASMYYEEFAFHGSYFDSSFGNYLPTDDAVTVECLSPEELLVHVMVDGAAIGSVVIYCEDYINLQEHYSYYLEDDGYGEMHVSRQITPDAYEGLITSGDWVKHADDELASDPLVRCAFDGSSAYAEGLGVKTAAELFSMSELFKSSEYSAMVEQA